MAEAPPARGIIDTSVVIDLEHIDPASLPAELAISAVTLAELAAGPHATADPAERARRRAAELGAEVPDVLADLNARDERDITRLHSPLAPAPGGCAGA